MQHKKNYCSFKQFLEFYGLSYPKAQAICGVHRTTFNRWIDEISTPPYSVYELLRLHATGEPPNTDNSWHDWRFEDNYLTCIMTRRRFSPTCILMIPALETQARELNNIKANFALQSKLF